MLFVPVILGVWCCCRNRFLLSSGGAWDLFRCANVICHELAHQWFGNLVTATTWPDLLVNEGLATLMEYGCMAAVLPQQVGPRGAAVLLRGMWGSPHAVTAGVHEGEGWREGSWAGGQVGGWVGRGVGMGWVRAMAVTEEVALAGWVVDV